MYVCVYLGCLFHVLITTKLNHLKKEFHIHKIVIKQIQTHVWILCRGGWLTVMYQVHLLLGL